MPFKFFRRSKTEKKEVTVKKDPLLQLCEKHFPEDPRAMYEELMRIPVNIPVGYRQGFEETIRLAEQKEKEGNIEEAAEYLRKAAGLAYKEGTAEDVKKFLLEREKLLERIPKEKRKGLASLRYNTILKDTEASWRIMREYLKLSQQSEVS